MITEFDICIYLTCRMSRDHLIQWKAWIKQNHKVSAVSAFAFDHDYERKMSTVFQGQKTMIKVVALLGRETL